MALVLDSSALVALVSDAGADGAWVASQCQDAELAAPELVMFEAADVLRRLALRGSLSPSAASRAHDQLLRLPIALWPYLPLAARCWALRGAVTAYDAAYVALAEQLGGAVVTLDERLARAPGARCEVLTPPS